MKGTIGKKLLKKMAARIIILAVGIGGVLLLSGIGRKFQNAVLADSKSVSREAATVLPIKKSAVPVVSIPPSPSPSPSPQEGVYTYLQGPKSWNSRLPWSGEWSEMYLDGSFFGGFGCGLCCMANVYSTLTKYQCSPLDMYEYTKKNTYYSGGMALEWGYMRQALTSLGFDCRVRKTPDNYKNFSRIVADSQSCIVLVSSSDSQVYWKDTPGHYVTIFRYDEENEKVFLADSGDPEHNRHWVSLKKIYKSLKTSSSWQYLQVKEYHSRKDSWRHKKTSGEWISPE